MISGAAAFSADAAAVLSPEAIAYSTLRTEVRMRERRAMLISVRRAITRVALRAEEVLAIDVVSGLRAANAAGFQVLKNKARRKLRRRFGQAYKGGLPGGASTLLGCQFFRLEEGGRGGIPLGSGVPVEKGEVLGIKRVTLVRRKFIRLRGDF